MKRKNIFILFLFSVVFLLVNNIKVMSKDKITANKKSEVKKTNTDIYSSLKFRDIGPAVAGGRVAAVVGIPGNPQVYYIGAAGGGVFKTVNGGHSWKAIFAKYPSSIGAIALAPSNRNLVWVGTGEANIRNDIIDGHGVYYSPDGGTTWKFMGLKDVGQISKIIIDPTNPDIVFVAAIGHAWAPNKDRGLFKSIDGGKSWKKVLYVNDTTGVSDVVFEPGNPQVMLAGAWQVLRHPWALIDGGDGSGVYKSTDEGETWNKLTKGLPKSPLGRISFATSLSNPEHVYALIESRHGTLWDSHDFGKHWSLVSNNHELNVRPFYFSRMEVAPNNDEKIYFLSFLITESTDGGRKVKSLNHGIHVDHHAIWIDPENPQRIIEGNDGGVYQSLNGGKDWKYFDNIPIEEFYQVAADTQIAYNLGGGLQDNNAWYGPSRNLFGGRVNGSNWFVVAGGDGEYVVPAPSNPDIVYSEAQDGFLNRLNLKTGVKKHIRPYMFDVSDKSPANLKYRFNWTSPIAVSYNNYNEVYLGANVLFKSMDGGTNWKVISPDLTRNDKSKQKKSGGPINLDMSGAETYGTILSISLSPQDSSVIWVGTDDGQVQYTKDGGKNWINVTKNIPGLPPWGRVYQLDVSPFSPGACYMAVDLHMLDNKKPYVYKTDDYGKNWTKITTGLPDDKPAHVIREDPNEKGFLFLGTETGLYFSTDNGTNWAPLKSNFPNVPVWDLKFVKQTHDLAVATHGRGIFILDNITPLEEMNKKVEDSNFYLFNLLPVYNFNIWYKEGISESDWYSAPNPPGGVVIDYYLKEKIKKPKQKKGEDKVPVLIKITDSQGVEIDTLHGSTKKGINRVEWNLHYKSGVVYAADTTGEKHPNLHYGPEVLPGKYTIDVIVNGKTETKTVMVKPDPRLQYNMEAARLQFNAAKRVTKDISSLNTLLNRIDNIHNQINSLEKSVKIVYGNNSDSKNKYKPILKQAHQIDSALAVIKDTVMDTKAQKGVGEDDIHYLTRLRNWLGGVRYAVEGDYDTAPTSVTMNQLKNLEKLLNNYINDYNNIVNTKIVEFNKTVSGKNFPVLFAGPSITIE